MSAQPKRKKYVQVVSWDTEEILRSLLEEDEDEAKMLQMIWSTQFDRRFYDIRIVEAG